MSVFTSRAVPSAGGGGGGGAVTSVAGKTGVVTLVVGDVSGAAPLASPTFTGTPAAPTPAGADNSTKVATTAFVKGQGYITTAPVTSVAGRTGAVTLAVADVSGAAPLASPTFSGTPAVPTAAPGTNSTQAASTAYVDAAVAAGGGGGGGAVTSVAGRTGAVTLAVADVSGAAPLASPALTGTPTAPTAAPGTNNTQVASTAYVDAAVAAGGGGGGGGGAVTSVAGRTGAVTLAVADVSGAAPLASPALTGTPTVPTAAAGTNTTQAASTAFVTAAVAAGSAAAATSTGRWLTPPVSAAASTAVAANFLYLSPLPIDAPMTLDRLGIRVATGAGGNCKLAAFTWDPAGAQFVLVSGSEITADQSTGAAAVIVGTPASNIVVAAPTVLWIGSVFSALPTCICWNAAAVNGGGLQRFIGQDDPPNANLLSTAVGYGRVTLPLTYVGASNFITAGAATIARSAITLTAAAPGSPIAIARRL